uniref:Uncharacterized protein n=1 Tax=Rhizophora mucronata TaxID=61149 RepID=A0A2P2R4K2_RHIMU
MLLYKVLVLASRKLFVFTSSFHFTLDFLCVSVLTILELPAQE